MKKVSASKGNLDFCGKNCFENAVEKSRGYDERIFIKTKRVRNFRTTHNVYSSSAGTLLCADVVADDCAVFDCSRVADFWDVVLYAGCRHRNASNWAKYR